MEEAAALIPLLLALSVTVEPAFLPCRPPWGGGATIVDAENPAGSGDRRVAVELVDSTGRVASVELDLPAQSRKRWVVMPPLAGRVTATLVEEDGTRTSLPYPFRQECQGASIAALVREDGRSGVRLPASLGGAPIETGTLVREDLAGSWRPLVALDAIAAEARSLHELTDAEWALLSEWVRAGGVLLVVPGVDSGPFFGSGRLPPELTGVSSWQSARSGAGFLAVTADASIDDPRLGSILAVAVDARTRWINALGRIYEAQRDRAGPAGRASRPAGVLSLGVCLLAAAAAHELLRRRFVAGVRDFRRYFQGLAIVLIVTALSGVLSAFVSSDPEASAELVVARSTGSGSRSRAFLLRGGRTRDLAAGAWPFGENEVRFVTGARTAVTNGGSSARVVLERTPLELGGALALAQDSLRNDTPHRFDAGWIVRSGACNAVPAIGPGEEVTHGAFGSCPSIPSVRLVAQAMRDGLVWYVTREGETHYVISLETP